MAAINQALRNVPRDRVRLHVCWGNSKSPHDCDVPLEDILPALQLANVGGLVLPFANPVTPTNFAVSPSAHSRTIRFWLQA